MQGPPHCCMQGRKDRSMMSTSCCLVILLLLQLAVGYVHVTPDMRSFSSAIKGGRVESNIEKLLYEHNTGKPGVITEQWFTGEYIIYNSGSLVSIIII